MNEALLLGLALFVGLALGAMFFGGLWWTIRKSFSSSQPGLLFLASLLARTAVAVIGFWLVLNHAASGGTALEFWALLACLSGFLIARALFTAHFPAPIEDYGSQTGKTGQ